MGTIRLLRGTDQVEFIQNVEVERSVGRPGGELSRRPDGPPTYIDKHRAFSDVFEITGVLVEDPLDFSRDGRDVARTLREDVLRDPLGTAALDLEFVSNLFGLGSYKVLPVGNRAARLTYNTGETTMTRVDNLTLRVVQL